MEAEQNRARGNPLAPPHAGAGGLSATALKTIAILAMVVDHGARAFVAEYYSPLGLVLHMVGRITGPTMFFFIVEGYRHTRNVNRYTLRMGVFAVLSYLPFIYFRTGGLPNAGNWMMLNVIYTLFIGLLALRAMHEVDQPALRAILVVLCFVASIPGDWSYTAVLYILVFDWFYGNFKLQALGYTLITLTQLLAPLAQLVGGLLRGADFAALWPSLAATLLYCAFFLPLLLLAFYNGKRGKGGAVGRWFFYIFYPAHLLVLGLLQKVVTVRF